MYNEVKNLTICSMTFTKLKPDISVDEARKIWDESVMPTLKEQKGFIGGFLLVSEKKDEGITFGLWESKKDAEAIQKSGMYKEDMKKFAAFIAPPTQRKFYNVNSEIVFVKEIEAL
jgi:heme-degrading monooxygenase HmoA